MTTTKILDFSFQRIYKVWGSVLLRYEEVLADCIFVLCYAL